jgi:tetratricopeptide (TPR) repeat protein
MRHFATTLLAGLIFIATAGGATLREQLADAREAQDIHAQIELIRRILDSESDDELSEELVALWLSVSDYDMAEAVLKHWENAPESFQVGTRAEILFKRDEKRAEAIALLEAYHAKDPADLVITRQLARYLATAGEPKKIVALLSTAPGVSDDASLLLARASAKRALADFDGALGDFALADKVDPGTAVNERASYDRLRDALPGIKSASAALEKNPADFPARVRRAHWYLIIGADKDLIREDVEAAHAQAPQSVAATLLYARALLDRRKARAEFSVDLDRSDPSPESLARLVKLDQVLAKNARDAGVLTARSSELNDTPAQYQLALKDAAAALEIDSNNADARLEKIYALLRLNRTSEAAAEVLILESGNPPSAKLARACGYLADSDLKAYRLESALDYATKGLKAAPSAELYKTRAAILQRLGRVSEANEDLASAKKLGGKS